MFRFRYGSKWSPKLNLSSPSSPSSICHPSPAAFSGTANPKTDFLGTTSETQPGSLGSSPRQPLPPLHGGVLSLPVLDVTFPAGSSTLDVLVKVTVAFARCLRQAMLGGDGTVTILGKLSPSKLRVYKLLAYPAGCKVAPYLSLQRVCKVLAALQICLGVFYSNLRLPDSHVWHFPSAAGRRGNKMWLWQAAGMGTALAEAFQEPQQVWQLSSPMEPPSSGTLQGGGRAGQSQSSPLGRF